MFRGLNLEIVFAFLHKLILLKMKYILLPIFFIISVLTVKAQDVVKPNIIIFYADDLGWQDSQLNDIGDPVPWETPNMLSLAAEGANFTQAYSPAPTCTPSRAAMISGLHPAKTTMTNILGGRVPAAGSNSNNKLITPYFTGRLKVKEITIAEALKSQGYKSGHIGKWHMAVNHHTFPEAIDQGFDFQFTGRGITRGMADRTNGYATDSEDDPYRIDEDGRPYDEVTEEALSFLEDNKSEPFFMYMATWLVHAPIQTRDLALLTYYCNKLGIPVPTEDTDITTGGQTNPYYGAMVASLDWSLGKIVDYLKTTDDPRNPGKKLFKTTYLFFSSDNGGAEKVGAEIITDNYPLDQGKKYTQEGGIRTPLLITGPGIPSGAYDNVVSHLDFFPTILSLTNTTVSESVSSNLDGANLAPLLKGTTSVIDDGNGNERTDLFWHFPHGLDATMQSALRSNEYKLYKNHLDGSYEIYQLYDTNGNFEDIKETTNIINSISETKKNELISKLETLLNSYNARYPHKNPDYTGGDAPLPNQNIVPIIVSTTYNQDTKIGTTTVSSNEGQAKISKASIVYKENEPNESEEWFEATATVTNNIITATIPESATGFVFLLVDENNFLIKSEDISTVPVSEIILNTSDVEQLFNPSDNFSELSGDAVPQAAYIQSRSVGSGAVFNVKSTDNSSVVCSKVTFRGRSRNKDNVSFNIRIGSETKSFTYTSSSDTFDVNFDFDIPVEFTNLAQEMEYVITDLSNSDGLSPRFRIYNITFHVSQFLSIDNITKGESFDVFPNPVNDVFNLSEDVDSGVLYNMAGKKVSEFKNKSENINISNLKSGIYLLRVTYKSGSINFIKLIKK